MAWYIASSPFWLLGALLIADTLRTLWKASGTRDDRTASERGKDILIGALGAAVCFYIAAKLCQ